MRRNGWGERLPGAAAVHGTSKHRRGGFGGVDNFPNAAVTAAGRVYEIEYNGRLGLAVTRSKNLHDFAPKKPVDSLT